MSTNAGSAAPSAERGRVRRVALVTHGRVGQVKDGVERLVALATTEGVELLVTEDEAGRHGLPAHGDPGDAELVVVLGGDGTMLRASAHLPRYGDFPSGRQLRAGGFLSLARSREELEVGLRRGVRRRAAGSIGCRRSRSGPAGQAHVAVNDVVVTSGEIGRMVELEWAVGGEDIGRVPCDGLICSTPSGSTAYNLSNGGPVLMWGIDALATT